MRIPNFIRHRQKGQALNREVWVLIDKDGLMVVSDPQPQLNYISPIVFRNESDAWEFVDDMPEHMNGYTPHKMTFTIENIQSIQFGMPNAFRVLDI